MELADRVQNLIPGHPAPPPGRRIKMGGDARLTVSLLLLLFFLSPMKRVAAQDEALPVVQAVLFYSPTCPHCHQTITEFLQPLAETYGDQLQLLGLDVTQEAGQYLYQRAALAFQIPEELRVVPTLIAGEEVMIGSIDIEERFAGVLDEGLAQGGIGWPDIPELVDIVFDLPPAAGTAAPPPAQEAPTSQPEIPPEPTVETTPVQVDTSPTAPPASTMAQPASPAEPEAAAAVVSQVIAQSLEELQTHGAAAAPPPDPLGFTIGWSALALLVAGLLYGIFRIVRSGLHQAAYSSTFSRSPIWTGALLALAVAGLAVSLYLSAIEMTQARAAWCPVGHCSLVQASPYARILGLPVASLGTMFYLLVGALWLLRPSMSVPYPRFAAVSLPLLTLLGTLFSIYLTLLELLVIHAVCIWCLTSAVVTAAIFTLIAGTTEQNRPQIIASE